MKIAVVQDRESQNVVDSFSVPRAVSGPLAHSPSPDEVLTGMILRLHDRPRSEFAVPDSPDVGAVPSVALPQLAAATASNGVAARATA